jgi:hypothetical protein
VWSKSGLNTEKILLFCVVGTVNFGLKMYNNQRNTQVFKNLFVYLILLTCFGLSFSPSSGAGVHFRQWFKSHGNGVSARALTPYRGALTHCLNCTPAPEDGLKESPKYISRSK